MPYEIGCNKCGGFAYVETDDYMQAEVEESDDFSITFRFYHVCDNEYIDEDNEHQTCDNVIEVVKYATIQSHFDVEQQESE